LALGCGRRAIGRRIEHGRLHHTYRGVYSVGHRVISREGRWMAAVLASGEGAVLSHQSAAALWGIRPSGGARVSLTVARSLRPHPKLIRHCAVLDADERTTREGIPATTVPRTLFDLAAVLHPQALARAFEQAAILRLLDTTQIAALLDRHPRRKGAARLRPLLDAAVDVPHTRQELERRFLAFVEAGGFPRPRINTTVETFEVDAAWPERRLIAELDGFATHGTRQAFERDRRRDRRLQAAGWRVVRITWRHLHDEPGALARELRAPMAS
jgi:very-short-patch-repair endonuclease